MNVTTAVSASEKLSEKDARHLLASADKLYSARGKNVTTVDLKKEKLNAEMIAKLMLGPTGNLRAPTFRLGRTLVVGFDEETYRKLLL